MEPKNNFGGNMVQQNLLTPDGAISYEGMNDVALHEEYNKKIGVSFRGDLNRNDIINAIKNPEIEKKRLAEIDKASDREDISSTYRRVSN